MKALFKAFSCKKTKTVDDITRSNLEIGTYNLKKDTNIPSFFIDGIQSTVEAATRRYAEDLARLLSDEYREFFSSVSVDMKKNTSIQSCLR